MKSDSFAHAASNAVTGFSDGDKKARSPLMRSGSLVALALAVATWFGLGEGHSAAAWASILVLALGIGVTAGIVHWVVVGRWGLLSVALDYSASTSGMLLLVGVAGSASMVTWALVYPIIGALFGAIGGVVFFADHRGGAASGD